MFSSHVLCERECRLNNAAYRIARAVSVAFVAQVAHCQAAGFALAFLDAAPLHLALAMAKRFVRMPLGQREAQIIKGMKRIGRLPVTTIATIVGRHKKSVYKDLSGKAGFANRGPKNVCISMWVSTLMLYSRAFHKTTIRQL